MKRNKIINAFKNKDILKAILFTLAALLVYRLGCAIPTPGTTVGALTTALSGSSILTMFSMFTGGSLDNYSIFTLGVSPYITASIVVQLLGDIIPYLSELRKTGEKGRVKLNRITRWAGFVLAILQAFSLTYGFDKQYGILQYSVPRYYVYVTCVLVAGYSATVWIADAITRHGIANGQSMIIFAGIVAKFPSTFASAFSTLISGKEGTELYQGIGTFVAFCLLFAFIIFAVIFIEGSYRKIHIRYAGQSYSGVGRTSGSQWDASMDNSYIPVKVNSASVIPVIFAQSLISIILIVTSYVNYDVYEALNDNWLSFGGKKGLLIYALLIIFFTFMYTEVQEDFEAMAKNLSQNNGYIANVRPGKDTEDFLRKTYNRVTVAGAFGLVLLALLPYVLAMFTDLSSTNAVMGTGMIIVVGVAIEAVNNVRTMMAPYKRPSFY